MRGGAPRRTVWIGLVAVVAACGPDDPAAVPPPKIPPVVVREHVAAEAPPTPSEMDAAVDAFVARALTADQIEDEDERFDALDPLFDELVAAGEPGARAAVALLLRDPDTWEGWIDSFADANPMVLGVPVLEALETATYPETEALRWSVFSTRDAWRTQALRARAARAIMGVIDQYRADESVPDDELADDEARAEVASSLIDDLVWEPAVAALIAEDLARTWRRWTMHDGDEDVRSQAAVLLGAIGGLAAPAVPIVIEDYADLDERTAEQVIGILQGIGSSSPAALPVLRAYLDHEEPWLRQRAAIAFRSWGGVPADVRPRMEELLSDPDPGVREAAAYAFASTADGASTAWRELVQAAASSDWGAGYAESLLRPAASRSGVADEMLAGLTDLSVGERRVILSVISDVRPELVWPTVERLAASNDPQLRRDALHVWPSHDGVHPTVVVRLAAQYLRDTDEHTRTAAAIRFQRSTLASLHEPARAVLIASLAAESVEVRELAIEELSQDDAPLGSVDANAVRLLEEELLSSETFARERAQILVRCEDGVPALERAVRPHLGRAFDPEGEARAVVEALRGAGAAARGLAGEVAAIPLENAGRYEDEIRTIRAYLSSDAMEFANTYRGNTEYAIDSLLDLGPSGAPALVRFIGRTDFYDDFREDRQPVRLVRGRDTAALHAAIVQAAGLPPGEDTAEDRLGAARLLPLLPANEAWGHLRRLSRMEGSSTVALESLVTVGRAHPGAAPLDDVVGMLRDEAAAQYALFVVEAMGRRDAARLIAPLRGVAVDGESWDRIRAAALLWRWGGDVEDAASVIRDVLRNPVDIRSGGFSVEAVDDGWREFVAVLLTAKRDPADVALLVEMRAEWTDATVLQLIARYGADAAPAVPWVREFLTERPQGCVIIESEFGDPDPRGEAAAHALVAIGPAAKVVLPDLRRRVGWMGDSQGVVTAAIDALEAMD